MQKMHRLDLLVLPAPGKRSRGLQRLLGLYRKLVGIELHMGSTGF